jgi:subtilisin family serine protease
MPSVWNKIDPGLATIYADYLRVREHGPGRPHRVHPVVEAGGRLQGFVHFTAELEELEALGFECVWQEDENRALGTIDLADLERLAKHPGVHRILFGREPRRLLDVSVPDIGANKVWTHGSGDVFTGATGKGAIVGIIDTGIDFRHKFFLGKSSPPTTRIRRIWDQGLTPDNTLGEKGPDPALLSGGPDTYGVEYTDAHINDVLRKTANAPPVRHRDGGDHGTHVASIAAGDGRPAYKYIGVAPRADLVVVKLQDLESDPKVGGNSVPDAKRLYDAVDYILKVSSQLGLPVVINCSQGFQIGPHDGFTDEEDWLTNRFARAKGQVFVAAAGNEGDLRKHARIELQAATAVEIPLELYDTRAMKDTFSGGRWVDGSGELIVDLYYPHGGPTLSATLELPSGLVGVEDDAPALGDSPNTGLFAWGRHYEIAHSEQQVLLRGGRGTVTRNNLQFTILPRGDSHETGTYKLTLTASGPLTVHLWCLGNRKCGFKLGASPPPEVFVGDRFLIAAFAGAANILTVAGYDAEAAGKPIGKTSSKGPLAYYGSGPAPQPSKPDLAAPGAKIDAAQSRDSQPPSPGDTSPMWGTSMSAPHVAGAVALMLAKKPTLAAADAASILRANADKWVPPVDAAEGGAGRLNAEKAFKAN